MAVLFCATGAARFFLRLALVCGFVDGPACTGAGIVRSRVM
jgi:hypothetical protein